MWTVFDAGVGKAVGADTRCGKMCQALSIGIIINRGKRGGGTNPMPAHLLQCATRNGAKALGRDHDLGSLEPGKLADLTIINLRSPRLVPAINLLSNIVHYGQASDVESVMVGGQLVMEHGKVLTMNEEDVLRNAQEAASTAWRRLHEMFPDIAVPEVAARL